MTIEIDYDKFREWIEKKDLEISLSNLKDRVKNLERYLLDCLTDVQNRNKSKFKNPLLPFTRELEEYSADLRGLNANLNEPITHKYANLCEPMRTNYTKESEPIRTKNTEIRGLKRTPRTNKNFRDNLIKEIIFYIKQSYSTTEIKDIIIEKFGIKKTCFYKYLKLSRKYLNAIFFSK